MHTVNSYYLIHGGEWPPAIEATLHDCITAGVINVEPNSLEETRLVALCDRAGILGEIAREEFRYAALADELQEDTWYYLQTEPVRTIPSPLTAFFNRSTVCGGADRFRCEVGARQMRTIPIAGAEPFDFEHIHAFGGLLFISARGKAAIEAACLTGCRFLPPAEPGGLLQLVIEAGVLAPPDVGAVRMTRRCPRCGVVYQYVPEVREGSSPRCRANSLADADFQVYRAVRSSSHGDLLLASPVPLVSGRALKRLHEAGISGFAAYCDYPTIPFRAVEMQ